MSTQAVKGFNRDMTCRGFQFEEGKTYEHDGPVEVCQGGFHAVTMPLDILKYYPANRSVYHLVDMDDVDQREDGNDSKLAARKITIGAKLNLTGLIKAQVDFVFKNSKPVEGASSAKKNAAVKAEVENGAATASGRSGAATASGRSGAATASGYSGAATASGDYGAATASGYSGAATASGYSGRARGSVGCALFLAERATDMKIIAVAAVIVDGAVIKADVFYTLRDGKVVEA